MDRSVAWRAALLQALLVAAVAVVLPLALPTSFFEDWGWLAGPAAWGGCALVAGGVPAAAARAGAGRRGAVGPADADRRRGRRPLDRVAARPGRVRRLVRVAGGPARRRRWPDGPRAARSRRARDRRLEGDRPRDRRGAGGRGRPRGDRLALGGADRGHGRRDRRARLRVRRRRPRTPSRGCSTQVEADLGPIDVYIANTGGPPAATTRSPSRASSGRPRTARSW